MKSKICLIRHGITEGNKRKLYYGHSDIDLAPEGVEELKAQAEYHTKQSARKFPRTVFSYNAKR